MPPANSPDSEQPISFISALRELESPVNQDVLNLAATLGSIQHQQNHLHDYHHQNRQHHQEGDRLRRVMSRLSRLNDSSSSTTNTNPASSAYGDRVPSANNLYDWSPANEADDEDELDHILEELRREQPNTHPEILRVLGRSQLDSERERIRSISSRLNSGESLRSTAILQSVRRHPRFSARTREYLQRYNSERERDRDRDRDRDRPTQLSESQARYMSEGARQMALQRLSENRPSPNPPSTASPLLEQTVKYLSRIRNSNSIDDSLGHALDAGFLSKDYFSLQYADFVTDTLTIPPPTKTSWLAPGAVLSGCQHATSVASALSAVAPGTTTLYNSNMNRPPRPSYPARSVAPPQPQPPQQDRWPVKVTIHEVDWDTMTLSATMEAYNVPSHPHANSSQPQQYTRTSSITTYLEGEILDFNNHTLLTESFKSSPANDATYWRKLPPFASMSDQDVIKALTSKHFFTSTLSKQYILMRWKERCFVKSLTRPSSSTTSPRPNPTLHSHATPSSPPYRLVRDPATNELQLEVATDDQHASFDDSGCGLTISGFYYVCLRRRDGGVEGLYCDPQSSPYQCLELESVGGGAVGAWGFR